MYEHRKRIGYSFNIHEDEASITIIRPLSGEFTQFGKYIVLYEDAFGGIELSTLTIGQIVSKYKIDQKYLEDTL